MGKWTRLVDTTDTTTPPNTEDYFNVRESLDYFNHNQYLLSYAFEPETSAERQYNILGLFVVMFNNTVQMFIKYDSMKNAFNDSFMTWLKKRLAEENAHFSQDFDDSDIEDEDYKPTENEIYLKSKLNTYSTSTIFTPINVDQLLKFSHALVNGNRAPEELPNKLQNFFNKPKLDEKQTHDLQDRVAKLETQIANLSTTFANKNSFFTAPVVKRIDPTQLLTDEELRQIKSVTLVPCIDLRNEKSSEHEYLITWNNNQPSVEYSIIDSVALLNFNELLNSEDKITLLDSDEIVAMLQKHGNDWVNIPKLRNKLLSEQTLESKSEIRPVH